MDKLIKILAKQGRSRRWLADKIGMHEVTLSKILNGKNPLTSEIKKKIANALDIPIDILF
ncbi:hypothetical protein LCGC14_0364670 [marine sediment metagenome]|uniref:HTH cro/C1-type domain-containing protein n=1 Tax=marine sediment metagenome TaxID=412755 RepID=A0A0F9T6Y1_9ZZZZ